MQLGAGELGDAGSRGLEENGALGDSRSGGGHDGSSPAVGIMEHSRSFSYLPGVPTIRIRSSELRTDEFLALLEAYERRSPVALRGDEWEVLRFDVVPGAASDGGEFVFVLRLFTG